MIDNKLTDERLDQYANDPLMCISDEVREMARELQRCRNAQPVAYYQHDGVIMVVGSFGYDAEPGKPIPLYASACRSPI